MKKLQLIGALCLLLVSTVLLADNKNTTVDLHQQLKEINSFWSISSNYLEVETSELKSTISFDNRLQLIQKHLSLVEQALRTRSDNHLTTQQQLNRQLGLDILNSYWQKGIFPKNTNHTFSIPYFIDDYNTACAVGHIMRESGSEKIANEIASSANNAYIAEIPQQKTLNNWANKMGFSVEELKWIQPTYGPPVAYNIDIIEPDCGANNGTISLTPFADGEGIVIIPDSLHFAWSDGTIGLSINNISAGQYCVNAFWDEEMQELLYTTCFWLNNNVSSDYFVNVQNESCDGNIDGAIGVATDQNADITVNWYDTNGILIGTGDTITGLDGIPYEYLDFGPNPPNLYTAEIIDGDGCTAYYQQFVFETSTLELSVTIQQEASCGDANGYASIFVNGGEFIEIIWSDGVTSAVERNDLAAGYYTVWVVDESGCETSISFEMYEECPAPINCEGDLSWAYELAESSDCICSVDEYYSPTLDMSIIFFDSDCNFIDDADTYYDCFGNWICSTNGEIADEDWCDNSFVASLELTQNLYSCYANDCNPNWVFDFWETADHIYCGATEMHDSVGGVFYQLSAYEAGGFIVDLFDCQGNYICRTNSDVPEDFICDELYTSLYPVWDIFICDENPNTDIINANDDFALGEGNTIVIDFLLNDTYPVTDFPLENTNWELISVSGGFAFSQDVYGADNFNFSLNAGIATFEGSLIPNTLTEGYTLQDNGIIEFDNASDLFAGLTLGESSFFYHIEGNRLYITEANIADGYTLEFISNSEITIDILSEPNFGSVVLNDNSTFTYTSNVDSLFEDYINYQICTEITGSPEPICDFAFIIITGFPPIGGCDYIELCEYSLCTTPITSTEICFEECGGITDPENVVFNYAHSLFECSIDILPNGCVMYTPLPGLEAVGADEITFSISDGNHCFEAIITMSIIEDCSASNCDNIELCEYSLCTTPITPTEICFEECGSNLNTENLTFNQAQSLFGSMNMNILPSGCVIYSPLPGFEETDSLTFSMTDGINCLDVLIAMSVTDDCSTIEPCSLESAIANEIIGFSGTEDLAQSQWFAEMCFTDEYNFGLDHITSYNWFTSNGDSSDAEQFCIEFPVRDNGINLDITQELCLEIMSVDCTQTTCILVENPLKTTANEDIFSAFSAIPNQFNVLSNDSWYNEIIIGTGQDEPILSIVNEPTNGIATISTDPACYGLFCDVINYTPNDGFVGTDELMYQLCVNDWCDTAYVSINVDFDIPTVIEGDVWPGDANADGIANNFDILALGLAFYSEGPTRPDATIEWTPQYAPNWESQITSITIAESFEPNSTYISYLIDNKHADCDGNGAVESQDVLAVEANYGLSHGKGNTNNIQASPESPVLSIEIQGDTLLAGSTVTADIILSMPDGSPVESAYGLAFAIDYENNVDDVPLVVQGTMGIEMIDSWMGNSYNTIKISKDFQEEQRIEVGYSRIDHQQLSGTGKIGTMSFIIEENVAGKTTAYFPLSLNIEAAFIGNANGTLVPANIINEVIEVTTSESNNPPVIDTNFNFYPNPVNEILTINLGDLNMKSISIIDLSGKNIYQTNNSTEQTIEIDITPIPTGIYLVNILTEEGYLITEKVKVYH